jgi:hypothetical protein
MFAGHSVDHDHVAGTSHIVRFELRHLVHMAARSFVNMLALHYVAHGKRRSYDPRSRQS